MFDEVKKFIDWNGAPLTISTGKFARQAHGAVMVELGNTRILCTIVRSDDTKSDIDFCPLTVNYQEKSYAAGKIPGGFFKTEGKNTERETLISRLIDRPIRPLFGKNFFYEVQILCTVHSYDNKYHTDVLSIIGASAALSISDLPHVDIVAAARVGYIDGNFVLNPTVDEMKNSKLDLVVAGTESSIMMVESQVDLLSEDQVLEAIKFGHKGMQFIIKEIKALQSEIGQTKLSETELCDKSLKDDVNNFVKSDIIKLFEIGNKKERNICSDGILDKLLKHYSGNDQVSDSQLKSVFNVAKSEIIRSHMIANKIRLDKRQFTDVRQIVSEVGLLPSAHGSSLFTRGDTQVLVATTLGTANDQQLIDGLDKEHKESFLLEYKFPPYSVGDISPLKGPSRRETGHGKLAWRAFKSVLPSNSEFPYTVRVVSEVTSCNGSSSMGTICGASMSMMNAGVPIKTPIAGIAMGLIKEQETYAILSDIIADEDFLGDMDFKIAGNENGISALQMDIKLAGIDYKIIEDALLQARSALNHVLEEMNKTISSAQSISDHAPFIHHFSIDIGKIRDVIGVGGKVIRSISSTTGANVDIDDNGLVSVSAVGKEKVDHAVKLIKDLIIDVKIGEVVECVVEKITHAGLGVTYLGRNNGFIHISEISETYIESLNSLFKEGDKIQAKIIGFDRTKGCKLTIRNMNKDFSATPSPSSRGPVRKSRSSFSSRDREGDNISDSKFDERPRDRDRGDRDRDRDRGYGSKDRPPLRSRSSGGSYEESDRPRYQTRQSSRRSLPTTNSQYTDIDSPRISDRRKYFK